MALDQVFQYCTTLGLATIWLEPWSLSFNHYHYWLSLLSLLSVIISPSSYVNIQLNEQISELHCPVCIDISSQNLEESLHMAMWRHIKDVDDFPGGVAWASYQMRKIAGFGVLHAPGMPGTFSPLPRFSDPDMHHTRAWRMPGSLTSCILWSRWREKRCRHSRRMRNAQFYVSGP